MGDTPRLDIPWGSLGHLLEDAAARHGDRTQFIFEGASRTFAETNRQVNRLANALRGLGIAKGDRVSVMLPNGFDFPTAWLALAKLGAVMVPTNTAYVERDLQFVLSDSGAKAILLDEEYLPRLEAVRASLPALEHVLAVGTPGLNTLIESASESFTIDGVGQDDLLNIQYTSGTTGFPKGCMLTHRYWLLMGQLTYEYLRIMPDDVDLTAQPFYYMDPQWNTSACMIAGVPLVIMPRFSVSRFWPTVHEHGVTFFYVLGTMPFFLMKRESDELERSHRLRIVACSGIAPDFHAEFERRFNVPWREAFGMTETGVDLLVPLDDAASVGSGAMGAPVRTKRARVIDAEGSDLPDGEIGQLIVSGEPMMLGYWNLPDKTAETIRDGWLHTGDLVYRDARGYFHWVGRLKDMVRRGGENISASEVESVIMEHERIRAAAVVPVPDPLRGEEVKVYVVLKDGETPETLPPVAIVEFAARKLARFKLPRYVEYVDRFPLTPSERVAKHELIKGRADLRANSYDMVDAVWR